MKNLNRKMNIKYKSQKLLISYFIRKKKGHIILYLHGWGCSKEDFVSVLKIPEFKDYTIVAFDFPGHGGSNYPKKVGLEIDDLVNLTEIIISKLKLGKFILVGHSVGGLVGLLYVEKYNNRIKGFINVEGNLAPEDCWLSRKIVNHSFEEFKRTIFKNINKIIRKKQNKGFQKYAKHLEKVKQKAYYDYSPTVVSYSENGNLIERFLKLKTPKIFIYGSENSNLSYLSYLKKKGCKLIEIKNSNHWPVYDNPQDYYKAICKFIKSFDRE